MLFVFKVRVIHAPPPGDFMGCKLINFQCLQQARWRTLYLRGHCIPPVGHAVLTFDPRCHSQIHSSVSVSSQRCAARPIIDLSADLLYKLKLLIYDSEDSFWNVDMMWIKGDIHINAPPPTHTHSSSPSPAPEIEDFCSASSHSSEWTSATESHTHTRGPLAPWPSETPWGSCCWSWCIHALSLPIMTHARFIQLTLG